jgi:hypothetical protein
LLNIVSSDLPGAVLRRVRDPIGLQNLLCKKQFHGACSKYFTLQILPIVARSAISALMTGRQFDAILKELGLTRPAAAKAMGMSGRSISTFANRKGAVPRRIELAIKGLLAERQETAKTHERK